MRLIDTPVGIFKHSGELVLKTEYMTQQDGIYYPECYIVRTGERFWGGVKEAKDLNDLDVEPVNVAEQPHWIPVTKDTLPEKGRVVIALGEKGTWDFGTYRGHGGDIHYWHWKKNTFKRVFWWMYKEDAIKMPER